MKRVDVIFKGTLEKSLTEHGFSLSNDTDDNIYNLIWNNDADRIISVQLILPIPGSESIFGIRGVQAIGNFRFLTPPLGVSEPSFYIFTFMNQTNSRIEFIITPSQELEKRLIHRNHVVFNNQETEFVFWLMEERTLYNTAGLGAEGRYYYIDFRMADNSNRCFTEFLNSWEILTTI